ncbi:polysaccharide biosynthesis protein [Algibacter sp. L3A6]|uniref:polysaccharide biosynthesis protein n=1 Tax=Algibacter sp. L3A6 TaxID=2686366 RepID=UPI00131BB080|nr:polysaccharide biosynthesis protein [Algibacter sp. L3A6]
MNKNIKYWFNLIAITGSSQLIIQVVALAIGFLIIRTLPVTEYAIYTLANSMLATMTLLTDGGIATGVLSEGGKVWKNKKGLGAIAKTGLNLRKKFARYSLAFAIPISIILLIYNNVSILMSIVVIISIIPAFSANLSDSILQIPIQLNQEIKGLQKNQLEVSIIRLILTVIVMLIFPYAFLILLAYGIPRIYGNYKLKKITTNFADLSQPEESSIKESILKTVKRRLPEMIFYCISGQLTIWLISIYGKTADIASLGAISRFSIMLNFTAILFTTLIIPRFARTYKQGKALLKKYLLILLLSFTIAILFIGVVFILKDQLLWILGDNYNDLKMELTLSALSGALLFVQGIVLHLNNSKNLIINPYLYIVISIIVTFISFLINDLSTVSGVILFSILITIIQLITLFIYGLLKISK